MADCRNVYRRISPALRERLEERDYLYVRHFGTGMGLRWQEAFQTTDRRAVEKYCADNDVEFSWGPGEELTTRQRRPVSAAHPETGEMTWFNHLTFFNVSALDPMVAEALLSMGKENLPNNTYYGDGAEIQRAVLDEIRAAYDAENGHTVARGRHHDARQHAGRPRPGGIHAASADCGRDGRAVVPIWE